MRIHVPLLPTNSALISFLSSSFSGFHAHGSHSSNISMPAPAHLGGWKEEEEEDEDDQEINSGSTPKKATPHSL